MYKYTVYQIFFNFLSNVFHFLSFLFIEQEKRVEVCLFVVSPEIEGRDAVRSETGRRTKRPSTLKKIVGSTNLNYRKK
jgi:hypothetical protein